MNKEELTPLATVKSIEPFEAVVVCNYKVAMNNHDTGCSQTKRYEHKVELPKGVKFVVGAIFFYSSDLIHLTIPDHNYEDVLVDYLKLENTDFNDLSGVSIEVNRNDLELKFEIVELYNYNKPDLKYASERLVVVERLMEDKEYTPDIPLVILNKRDELLQEMEQEDLMFPTLTFSELKNQLIYFMEDFLDKNKPGV